MRVFTEMEHYFYFSSVTANLFRSVCKICKDFEPSSYTKILRKTCHLPSTTVLGLIPLNKLIIANFLTWPHCFGSKIPVIRALYTGSDTVTSRRGVNEKTFGVIFIRQILIKLNYEGNKQGSVWHKTALSRATRPERL